jgi:alpha-ketoglutarate-dependent 2,4-dichlorophenoxyacetate dioxygenase
MGSIRTDTKQRLRPDLADVSNLDENNELLKADDRRRMFNLGNQLWHTDSSFKRTPAKASLLYAKTVPPIGGCTEFADLRAAYDALPEATKRKLEGLVAEHSIFTSRAKTGYSNFSQEERDQLPPVPQVIVRTHPGSKRKTLYLASHAGRIFGMEDAAAKALLAELIAHATQRQFVYTHRWRVGDLVMWDDRCTMHRGRPFDDLRYKRSVQRTTVADVAPTVEQEGIRLVA